ncbi:unnamed protein product [Brugia timori]|uniref:Uncharacterized protein n=1 Tax=Brugia timori TaxID=42155 RepID=A0A0R3QDS6_9BILA|nr:unnamed protein product [Brugia timori]
MKLSLKSFQIKLTTVSFLKTMKILINGLYKVSANVMFCVNLNFRFLFLLVKICLLLIIKQYLDFLSFM